MGGGASKGKPEAAGVAAPPPKAKASPRDARSDVPSDDAPRIAEQLHRAASGDGGDAYKALASVRDEAHWAAVRTAFAAAYPGVHRGDVEAFLQAGLSAAQLVMCGDILKRVGVALASPETPEALAAASVYSVLTGSSGDASASSLPSPQAPMEIQEQSAVLLDVLAEWKRRANIAGWFYEPAAAKDVKRRLREWARAPAFSIASSEEVRSEGSGDAAALTGAASATLTTTSSIESFFLLDSSDEEGAETSDTATFSSLASSEDEPPATPQPLPQHPETSGEEDKGGGSEPSAPASSPAPPVSEAAVCKSPTGNDDVGIAPPARTGSASILRRQNSNSDPVSPSLRKSVSFVRGGDDDEDVPERRVPFFKRTPSDRRAMPERLQAQAEEEAARTAEGRGDPIPQTESTDRTQPPSDAAPSTAVPTAASPPDAATAAETVSVSGKPQGAAAPVKKSRFALSPEALSAMYEAGSLPTSPPPATATPATDVPLSEAPPKPKTRFGLTAAELSALYEGGASTMQAAASGKDEQTTPRPESAVTHSASPQVETRDLPAGGEGQSSRLGLSVDEVSCVCDAGTPPAASSEPGGADSTPVQLPDAVVSADEKPQGAAAPVKKSRFALSPEALSAMYEAGSLPTSPPPATATPATDVPSSEAPPKPKTRFGLTAAELSALYEGGAPAEASPTVTGTPASALTLQDVVTIASPALSIGSSPAMTELSSEGCGDVASKLRRAVGKRARREAQQAAERRRQEINAARERALAAGNRVLAAKYMYYVAARDDKARHDRHVLPVAMTKRQLRELAGAEVLRSQKQIHAETRQLTPLLQTCAQWLGRLPRSRDSDVLLLCVEALEEQLCGLHKAEVAVAEEHRMTEELTSLSPEEKTVLRHHDLEHERHLTSDDALIAKLQLAQQAGMSAAATQRARPQPEYARRLKLALVGLYELGATLTAMPAPDADVEDPAAQWFYAWDLVLGNTGDVGQAVLRAVHGVARRWGRVLAGAVLCLVGVAAVAAVHTRCMLPSYAARRGIKQVRGGVLALAAPVSPHRANPDRDIPRTPLSESLGIFSRVPSAAATRYVWGMAPLLVRRHAAAMAAAAGAVAVARAAARTAQRRQRKQGPAAPAAHGPAAQDHPAPRPEPAAEDTDGSERESTRPEDAAEMESLVATEAPTHAHEAEGHAPAAMVRWADMGNQDRRQQRVCHLSPSVPNSYQVRATTGWWSQRQPRPRKPAGAASARKAEERRLKREIRRRQRELVVVNTTHTTL